MRNQTPLAGYAVILVLMWSTVLHGCSSWRLAERPPDEQDSSRIRVTLKSGEAFEMREAYVRVDTLIGKGARTATTFTGSPVQVWDVDRAIPLAQVAGIEERKGDPGKTWLTVLVGVVALGAIAYTTVWLYGVSNLEVLN